MDNDSKLRLLYIGKMLQNTDEEHPLTNADMMQKLEKKYGMTTHRTTIPSDIDLLIKSCQHRIRFAPKHRPKLTHETPGFHPPKIKHRTQITGNIHRFEVGLLNEMYCL